MLRGGSDLAKRDLPPELSAALRLAWALAARLGHACVGTEHLLLALAMQPQGADGRLLHWAGLTGPEIAAAVLRLHGRGAPSDVLPQGLTQAARRAVSRALNGPERLLTALLRESGCSAVRLLEHCGICPQQLFTQLCEGELARKERSMQNTRLLDQFGIDMLERAGKQEPVIGRRQEIETVLQILSRRHKNNPALIGEPGVGKTAIVEGVAQYLAAGTVPEPLRGKRLYALDMASVIAGTKYRGEFEERVRDILAEVRRVQNVILFVDEMHTLVGAGAAEGAIDAANLLKPALGRGELQLIGATTLREYRSSIEKDAALERRFQPVTVAEPSIDDSVKILEGIAHYYEECHQVRIPREMCREAVVLSERYITDRYLPDKAIDLIDEACSDVNLKDSSLARIDAAQKEIDDLNKERELLLADTENEHYERLAVIRTTIMQLTDELNALKAQTPTLTRENLARVIELWTKIPASTITEDEFDRLSKLGDRLREHIVGQDEAIDAVCAAIKRSRVGLQAKRKPVSFIFVGGTGVGKTELVKRLAEDLFNSPESLIRLDMSEFMEKFSVSRIIGSPPGYVGYDEAGQLTEKIRRKPYSVVLFDEIEKAHPDVMNILLQILDDGHITDAQGRNINFENTVIIMTTNAGSNTKNGSLGFVGTAADKDRERAMKALGDFLRPEFINRVDEIICFNKLTEDNFRDIAGLMLGEVRDLMREKGMELSWDESVIDYLVKKSYSLTYGARNLRRTIQKDIEDAMASVIVDGRRGNVKAIHLTSDGEKVNVEAE